MINIFLDKYSSFINLSSSTPLYLHFLLTCHVFKKKQYTKNKNIIWKQTKNNLSICPKTHFGN